MLEIHPVEKNGKKYYSVRQLAAYLDVSIKTAERLFRHFPSAYVATSKYGSIKGIEENDIIELLSKLKEKTKSIGIVGKVRIYRNLIDSYIKNQDENKKEDWEKKYKELKASIENLSAQLGYEILSPIAPNF